MAAESPTSDRKVVVGLRATGDAPILKQAKFKDRELKDAPPAVPWLVLFSHEKYRKPCTFFSIPEGRYYDRNIAELSRKYCITSSHGWLFMRDLKKKDCLVINPLSLETIHLPRLLLESSEFSYSKFDCIFSAPPSDPNCVILFIYWLKPTIVYWHRLHHKWRKMSYNMDEKGGIYLCAACDRKIYGITASSERLAVIDLDPNPNVRLMEEVRLPINIPFMRTKGVDHMIESCGEMFLVSLLHIGHDDDDVIYTVEVYRLDLWNMKFVGIESIGDRAFFCGNCSFSCSSIEYGVKKDCIYYFQDEDPILYRFDMADKSITMDPTCPNTSSPLSKQHWILPHPS